MGATFHRSMGWLHTWAGLVVRALLYAIVWMGTVSVFDRWMIPMARHAGPRPFTTKICAEPY